MTRLCTADEQQQLTRRHEAAVCRSIVEMKELLFERSTGLDTAAAAALYSRFHFHRTFREVTATTPARFLTGLRMQRAKKLLAYSDYTVGSISALVGYESYGTFTTQFGRLVGTSPGRFRRLIDKFGAELRIKDFERARWAPGAHKLICKVDANSTLEGRTVIVGIFEGGLPSGPPASFAMLKNGQEGAILVPPAVGPGSFALAVAVPNDIGLAELAIGAEDGILVGRTQLSLDQDVHPILLDLRQPRLFDPPVLSAAPALYLANAGR